MGVCAVRRSARRSLEVMGDEPDVACGAGWVYTSRLGRSNCDLKSNALQDDWIARTRISSGHCLTQRTETAICFRPWG